MASNEGIDSCVLVVNQWQILMRLLFIVRESIKDTQRRNLPGAQGCFDLAAVGVSGAGFSGWEGLPRLD